MLDQLFAFSLEWGLSVNIKKTAVLVFNKSGRLLKESTGFFYGDTRITSEREYCYLGLTFFLSGSMTTSQKKLKQKAMRSYFSLKKMIDFKRLKKNILFKLFGTLIYYLACRIIWMSSVASRKLVCQIHDRTNATQFLAKYSQRSTRSAPPHIPQVEFGVNRKTSNAAVWGDCGKYPLALELTKQVFCYYERLQKLELEGSDSLVRHAYSE